MNWLITIPKTVSWKDYQRELQTVADGTSDMNYRTRYIPKGMQVGDRCYVVWDGQVRGWMAISGVVERKAPWVCTTTGAVWPPGCYVQRSGAFHPVEGPAYQGFRGIRRYDP